MDKKAPGHQKRTDKVKGGGGVDKKEKKKGHSIKHPANPPGIPGVVGAPKKSHHHHNKTGDADGVGPKHHHHGHHHEGKHKHDKKDDKKDAGKEKKKDDEKAKSVEEEPRHLLRGDTAKRLYVERLMRSFLPVRCLAILFGQFPMSSREEKDGTYTFKFSYSHFNSVYFMFFGFISIYSLTMVTWNLYVHIVDLEVLTFETKPTSREQRWFEKSLLFRHFMWVMTMLASVFQCCFVTFQMWKNRYYMPSVYTFYTRLVQELHMDVSEGVFTVSLVLMMVYLCTTIAIMIMGCLQFAPITTGAPTLFGVYLFRLFVMAKGIWIDEDTRTRTSIQFLGAIFLIYIFTSSKIHMFMFIFHCKLLRNGFACWNGRAYIALMKGGKYFYTEEGRETYKLLYKDHCILLDALEAANRLYAGTMETYYALQMGTIFFEFYFFLRAARYGSDVHAGAIDGGHFFIRPFDWVPGLLLSFQSIFIAMGTAKIAANVGEEAMAGLDIVRRKTMLFRKTDDELLFQLSMQASYNSFAKFDIGAGGYEYINIDWIMGYVNNIAGYFIILYQFQPMMDRGTAGEWVKRKKLGKFLTNLESLYPNHWTSTAVPPVPTYPPP